MKTLRSLLALVFVLSLTLMSVAPAAADSAVTSFTGTAKWTEYYGWECAEYGKSVHCTLGGLYDITTTDSRVVGKLDVVVDKLIVNPQNPAKGPWHGTFVFSVNGETLWEGVAIGQPDDDPFEVLLKGHGVAGYDGLTLKLKITFDPGWLTGQVQGQVVGR